MVGIFVNESAARIAQVADQAALDAVQLHGDETREFCEELKRLLPTRFLIKVLGVENAFGVGAEIETGAKTLAAARHQDHVHAGVHVGALHQR